MNAEERSDRVAHGSLKSYLAGFLLSVVLTAFSFAIVMSSVLAEVALYIVLGCSAVAQIGVHLVFFLHLGRSSGQRWNVVVFIYTIVVLAVLLGASVWIMYHLNVNMMPH